MIRINLLSEGRRPVVARKAKAGFGIGDRDPSGPILLAGLVLAGLIAGGLWYKEKKRLDAKDAQIARAQEEVKKLEDIIRQVEEFKAQKADYENKIAVIQDLKRRQKGPVQVMDQISRALPELVWIESMRMVGTNVTLRGQALNTNAVASFIGNLNAVEQFREPDTKDVRSMPANNNRRGSYAYNIVFDFMQQAPPEEEDDGEAVAAAAGAP